MAKIVMLCHSHRLDRRVVQEATSLIEAGHSVTLLTIAVSPYGSEETTPEGLRIIRIGREHIVPDNASYRGYKNRRARLDDMRATRTAARLIRGVRRTALKLASRCNRLWYRGALLVRYGNLSPGDPLPFRGAFVKHGRARPSDLVQVHDLPALEAGAELATAWGVPLVYDAHELYSEQRVFSRAQRRICRNAETRLIREPSLVFTINDSIAEEMHRRYRIEKPTVLLNAIDPPAGFDPSVRYDLLRRKLGLAPKRKLLLFQGGFAQHRNLEHLIDAFKRVEHAEVDLILMGFGQFGDALKQRADRAGVLGKRVHFLPAVPLAELLQHSASADIGIIPYPHVDLNSYYCTPNKLFEYIQAGLPILANDSPELNHFVCGYGFGLTAPMRSAEQIAEAVDKVFAQSTETWRENLLRHRDAFSWRAQKLVYLDSLSRQLRTGSSDRPLLEEADLARSSDSREPEAK
ncbi:MAG: glycosyltransferase [Gammaproteobacteria bacterium]